MIKLITINTPPIICGAITAHYFKDGVSNILPNTNSQIKAAAILVMYD
nr:MAG TPA: hypothetical protein [Caudoviricetes sp.]